ncbi:hypothetical protein ACFONG_12390 [Uliginosibacterium paludis]|uniref:Uncharacterized protein n=1 Tax=Uliginosibacterium paludis TaxID=1615952 RepID=A0ABV2CQB0_9RHOO
MNADKNQSRQARSISAAEVGRMIHDQWVQHRLAELRRRQEQDRKH